MIKDSIKVTEFFKEKYEKYKTSRQQIEQLDEANQLLARQLEAADEANQLLARQLEAAEEDLECQHSRPIMIILPTL